MTRRFDFRPFGKGGNLLLPCFRAGEERPRSVESNRASRRGLVMKYSGSAWVVGLLLFVGTLSWVVGCSVGPSAPQTKTLRSIAVSAANPSIAKGTERAVHCDGHL